MTDTRPDTLAGSNGVAVPSALIEQLNQRIYELERQLAVTARERERRSDLRRPAALPGGRCERSQPCSLAVATAIRNLI